MIAAKPSLRILGFLLLLYYPTFLHGQLNRGVIEGIVTDPQGAVVPGAEVTITSVERNVTETTKTNDAGHYRALGLVPGKYRARFQASGFSTLELTDIEVSAGRVVRVDSQLKLGETTQLIEVSSEAPLIETAASNFSTTIETRTIEELPLQGRDLLQLVFLVPGVNSVAGPPGSNFGFNSQYGTFPDPTNVLGSNLSINGGQSGANAQYLDGNLNLSSFSENAALVPSVDATQEFQVITNAFAAEYSRTGGGIVNVTLKSGTNALHGNIYEFHRQSGLNARNPFTSIGTDPITGEPGIISDRQMRFNNFGGTVGGPVVIPKLYNGKDKTFFFFSWETQITRLSGQQVFTVPSARMRQGDFSEDPNAAQFGLWDPHSTIGPDSSGFFARSAFGTPRAGFPNGCTGYVDASTGLAVNPTSDTCNFSTTIPADRFDPTAKFFLDSYPSPNFNSPLSACPMGADGFLICANFLGGVGTEQRPHKMSIKFDHHASDRSKYFFEYLYNPGTYRNFLAPWTGPSYPVVGYGTAFPLDFKNQIFGLGNTFTFSPTFINEFRYSFSRQLLNGKSGVRSTLSELGALEEVEQQLAPARIPVTEFYPMPTFTISTPGGGGLSFGPPEWQAANIMSEAHNILDNVTKIIGRHTLKTGFVYRLEHSAWDSSGPTSLRFFGSIGANPITGLGGGGGLASFVLGAQDPGNFTTRWASPYQRWRYWGAYVQDDFRITPNFSLHLGLRWDLYGWSKTRFNPESNFCLECQNPLTGLPGEIIYSGHPQLPEGHDLFPANKKNFSPRFNFAWSPFQDRKTVIRGGYNMFTSNAANAGNLPGQFGTPGWLGFGSWSKSFYPAQCADFSYQCVPWPLSDTTTDKAALSVPPLTEALPAQKRDPQLASGFFFVQRPDREPLVQTWGLQVERELSGNLAVSIGYVGNRGTHLASVPVPVPGYHVPTSERLRYRSDINAGIPITDVFSGLTAEKLEEVYGSPILPRSLLLQGNPFFFPSRQAVYDGSSTYHGMNLSVHKKYSHGLSFFVAYTISKKLTNAVLENLALFIVDPIHGGQNAGGRSAFGDSVYGAGYQDPDNLRDKVIAVDDVPQMFNVAWSYELPFGNGKPFLNRKGILNGIFGGWKFASNFNASSGIPLGITCPGNNLTTRCNLVGDPNFSGDRSKAERTQQWINPAAFEPPFGSDQTYWANPDPNDDRAWVFGTAGPRIPGLRSPGFWTLDANLSKRFSITEQKYFEFRWDVLNALNHQNLGYPNRNFCLPPGPNGETDLVRQSGCSFGRITNVQTDPRAMQFGLKFVF